MNKKNVQRGIIFLGIFFGGIFLWGGVLVLQKDVFLQQISHIKTLVVAAGFDEDAWHEIRLETNKLPSLYPISCVKNIFFTLAHSVFEIKQLSSKYLLLREGQLTKSDVLSVFESAEIVLRDAKKIDRSLSMIPSFFLPSEYQFQKQILHTQLKKVIEALSVFVRMEKIVRRFFESQERVLLLLQNTNEPRSTGGFVGSFFVIDFEEDSVRWKFEDVYAIDRKVPLQKQLPAPWFLKKLSPALSLRDANIVPDFFDAASLYRTFFSAAGEKAPGTVLAINLHFIEKILKITGPVELSKWGLKADASNFDLVLQFLVEGKVEGRFGVKKPVLTFAEELFRVKNFSRISWSTLFLFSFPEFLAGKNVLGASLHPDLQLLFEKWKIDGKVRRHPDADNFLLFDFFSVGANKSEKFVCTKLKHNSRISSRGKVVNTIEIVRHHALARNEIQDLLGTNSWMPNLKDLLTQDLLWTLGAGENRIVLRVFVPADSRTLSLQSPSGDIREAISDNKEFRVYDVPIFVNSGERITTTIEYETYLNRGTSEQRPYFLHVWGTPGRKKTELLVSISPEEHGRFLAETMNLGRPVPLSDQFYRAILEFQNAVRPALNLD